MNMQSANAAQETAIFSRRFGSVLAVIAFHVLIVYLLIIGTGNKLKILLRPALITEVLEEKKPPPPPDDPPPKLPLSKFTPPPLLIPPPEVKIEQPAQANALHATVIDSKPANPPPAIARYVPDDEGPGGVTTDAWLETSSCELPAYPWQLSNREQGTVILALLIDVNGRVLDSQVTKSSGVKLLDQVAKNGMSQCKYRPGTLDGKPQKMWKKLRFIWQLPY